MKRSLLTLGLIAFIGLTAASCSTDDSAINDASADELKTTATVTPIDNGDKDLPKPPHRP